MTLDEILVALTLARKELPGDTPVVTEHLCYSRLVEGYLPRVEEAVSVSFFPAPKDDTERRITIR